MKKLEEMTIFELKEYRDILLMLKDKYAKEFAHLNYDYDLMYNTFGVDGVKNESSDKFNRIEKEIEKVDKLIEKMIFKKYDKKDK